MKKNSITITVAILLILYGLTNFAAASGQFFKGDLMSGLTGAAVSTGNWAASSPANTANSQQLKKDTARIGQMGQDKSFSLYAISLFILAVAIVDIVAAVGIFGGTNWARLALILAGIGGILVEIQDVAEDGMGIAKIVFFAINGLALLIAFTARSEPARA